jgi:transglutaminase-like putative cysteine protease
MKMPSLSTLPRPKKNDAPTSAKAAKAKKMVKVEPAEDSVGLRLVACAIAVLCIVTGCLYVNSTPMVTFLYLWGALTGSYVSYQFRHQKTFWITFITSAGLLIVLGHFFEEIFGQYLAGKVQALVPFIHVLTGLQALHTFDLRAKSDINVSALIGLGLFACTAVLARDLTFAYITLAYIGLAASLLYYEAVSRTQSAGAIGTSSERAEIDALRETAVKKRVSVGNAFVPLALLPLLSIFVFLALPRVESIFDLILSNLRRAQNGETLNLNWIKSPNGVGILGTMPGLSGLPISMGGKGGTGPGGKPGGDGAGGGASGGTSGTELTNGASGTNGDGVKIPGVDGGPGGKTGKGNGQGANSGKPGKTAKGAASGKSTDPKVAEAEAKAAQKAQEKANEKAAKEEDKSMVFRNKSTAEHDEELIMRVMSSRDTYFRRLCFDTYDGHEWTISSLGKVSKCSKHKNAYQELAGVPSLFVEPGMHSAQLTQEITIEANIGHLIPVAAIPQQLSFPKDPILVDQFGALRSKDPLIQGTHYRVVSQVPDYNLDEMRKAPFDARNAAGQNKEFENYLQLPADLNPEVIKLAKSVAGSDGNSFTRAERICNFLRRNYKYSSDLNDANNKEEIAYHFLFRTKEGACGPFSTSFLVMCRAIGLPARCIGGFGPGDFNAGTGMHEIKNKHGHAWGEVYIPGYDWVPFDSTPTGLLPQPTQEDNSFMGSIKKSMEQIADHFSNQTPTPPPLPAETAKSKDSQSAGQTSGQGDKTGANSNGTMAGHDTTKNSKANKSEKGTTDNASTAQGPGAKKPETKTEPPKPPDKPADWHELILLIIVAPAVMLLFQAIKAAVEQARLARKSRSTEKPKPSTLLYLKVVDDLARVKIHRLPTDTPEDLMSRFSADELYVTGIPFHPDLEPLCQRFMELYIADRFGCDDATELRAGQLKKMSEQIHTLVRTRLHDN